MVCEYIETLELDEFAAKYLPILEARDAQLECEVTVLQDETPVNHSSSTSLDVVSMASGERARKTFYPTPEALAEKLLAGIKWDLVESILEPSAGKGDLARYVAGKLHYRHYRFPAHDEHDWARAISGADIDCVEIDPLLRNTLEGSGFRVVHDDFLTYETQKRYHLIVMNPPFDQGAEHLLKALELSERGGMVYCILNAETLRNPCTQRRVDLAKKLQAYGADIEYATGAFQDAERKTDVDVALVRVNIPYAKVDSTIMDDMRKAPTYKSQRVPNEYAEVAHYDEIEKWVNMYNFEVACGIRLIEEWQAMRESMQAIPELRKHEGKSLELKIGSYIGCGIVDCSGDLYEDDRFYDAADEKHSRISEIDVEYSESYMIGNGESEHADDDEAAMLESIADDSPSAFDEFIKRYADPLVSIKDFYVENPAYDWSDADDDGEDCEDE